MATNFPTSIDTFTNPDATSYQDSAVVPHATQHANANDAIEALEASVWITGSSDTSSLRYMQERLTTKWDILVHNWTNYARLPRGTDGYMVVADSAEALWVKYAPTTSGGTVTTASVVSANWFAWSVANASTTPAITLTTSITWVLKGNWTAISAATAGTDYSVPTGVETLTNKTLTSPTINSPTIATPIINVWSDANGDMYYRASWTTARLAKWSANDFMTSDGTSPVWSNPFTYTWSYIADSTSASWAWNTYPTTSRQTNAMTVANVALNWAAGSAYLEYSPDNAAWTSIITVTWATSASFPILMKKWYYYRVTASATVNWPTSTASINYIQ